MRLASESEIALGIEVFYTDADGIGGKLRKTPEDFQVEERSIVPRSVPNGQYTIIKIQAKNWETNKLVLTLAQCLKLDMNKIVFAGTKDKRALTTQLFGIRKRINFSRLKAINLRDVALVEYWYSNKLPELGELIGNKFKIKIRDLDQPRDVIKTVLTEVTDAISNLGGFPNFFGIQRFGAYRPNTHIIGKYIIKGDFKRAILTYIGNPIDAEHDVPIATAQKVIERSGDFKYAYEIYPHGYIFERMLLNHLVHHPDDYIGALKCLPKNLRLMFIHAYQSYIFNKILSLILREQLGLNEPLIGDYVLPINKYGLPDHTRPICITARNYDKIRDQLRNGKAYISGLIFGCESEYPDNERGELEHKVIEGEGIAKDDFIVAELPELTSKGTRRALLAPIQALNHEIDISTKSVRFEFQLFRGCYATSFLREYMKCENIKNY
jgi:tRNA pseudouridine13 synthase